MNESINPIIYVVSTKRVVRRIDGLHFENRQSLEDMLTGISYGTIYAGKNYAIVSLLNNGELITRSLYERHRTVLHNSEKFQIDKELVNQLKRK